MPRTPTALAASVALLSLTAAGCSFFAPGEEDLDFAEYEPRLTDTYNESVRLAEELDAAEARIKRQCLEEQGFTVHDLSLVDGSGNPAVTARPPEPERETFMDQPPHQAFLPAVEEAGRRGFWQWTALPGAEAVEDGDALMAEWEAYQSAMGWTTSIVVEHEDEEPEFHSLPQEEQDAWYEAYGGEAWAAWTRSEGDQVEPPPGGCVLAMIEAVYGGLEAGEDRYSVRPSPPDGDWTAMKERYAEGTADAEGDLLDCLEDRGRDGWEFYDGHLLVHDYLVAAGEGEFPLHSYPEAGIRWPDPPDDVPETEDVQGWLDFERDLAMEVAECGDESGFREAAEDAWEQAQLRYYLDIEEATYAWQEKMRRLIERAQEVIGG